MRPIGFAVFLLLASCGSPAANLPDPTHDDLAQGVIKSLRALQVGYHTWIPNLPARCQPGTMGDVQVRTCNVCAITMYRGNLYSSNPVTIRRENFSVVFKRAVSSDQPEVAPLTQEGVWAPVIPQSQGYAPPAISRSVLGNYEVPPGEVGRMLGLDVRQGFTGEYFYGTAQPDAIWEMLGSVEDGEISKYVGACE